jgi:hypothetical protein
MPVRLTHEEQDLLSELSNPLEPGRREDFRRAVEQKIEETAPHGGAGAVHRAARTVQRDYWDPPLDLRQGRLGPRGPRS